MPSSPSWTRCSCRSQRHATLVSNAPLTWRKCAGASDWPRSRWFQRRDECKGTCSASWVPLPTSWLPWRRCCANSSPRCMVRCRSNNWCHVSKLQPRRWWLRPSWWGPPPAWRDNSGGPGPPYWGGLMPLASLEKEVGDRATSTRRRPMHTTLWIRVDQLDQWNGLTTLCWYIEIEWNIRVERTFVCNEVLVRELTVSCDGCQEFGESERVSVIIFF